MTKLLQWTTLGEAFGGRGQPAPASEGNPFQRDANGQRNVTAIGTLARSNPTRAKELCRAAGESVKSWFPENPR